MNWTFIVGGGGEMEAGEMGGSAARSQIVGAYLIAAASSAAGHEFATWL